MEMDLTKLATASFDRLRKLLAIAAENQKLVDVGLLDIDVAAIEAEMSRRLTPVDAGWKPVAENGIPRGTAVLFWGTHPVEGVLAPCVFVGVKPGDGPDIELLTPHLSQGGGASPLASGNLAVNVTHWRRIP